MTYLHLLLIQSHCLANRIQVDIVTSSSHNSCLSQGTFQRPASVIRSQTNISSIPCLGDITGRKPWMLQDPWTPKYNFRRINWMACSSIWYLCGHGEWVNNTWFDILVCFVGVLKITYCLILFIFCIQVLTRQTML